MELLYMFERLRTPLGDAFFSLITHLGEETLFIVFGLLIFWCLDKWEGYYLLSVGLSGTVINQFLKLWFRIPRPWVRDPNFTAVESALAQAGGYSFPSGHTQNAVAVFGGVVRWGGHKSLRAVCAALCVLVPLSRLYLGVHTPADVGVSTVIALVLVFGLYPVVRKAAGCPGALRPVLAAMTLLAAGFLAFVSLYPFPADTDAVNLAFGVKNAHVMLGCMLGLWLSYEADLRAGFDTRATLAGQALKLGLGLVLLLAIRSAGKAVLYPLLGAGGFADGLRYFLMVVFAGCLWPRTFPFWSRVGKKR